MSQGNIGFELTNMTPMVLPASGSFLDVITTNNGVILACGVGSAVPTTPAGKYATGCIYIKVNYSQPNFCINYASVYTCAPSFLTVA